MTKQRAGRRPPPPRRGRQSSTIVLGVVGLVIAGAAVAAIVLSQAGSPAASGSGEPSASSAGSASAQVVGGALPGYVDGVVDPAVGQKVPEVVGASFDGTPVSIKADGRPKLLLFLAHWCSHCQREVPVVQAWINANGLPASVDLISVSTAVDPSAPNYPPDVWLAREHWTPPVIADGDRQVETKYGLTAFPYWVAVGADGTVVRRLTGELTPAQLDDLAASVTPK
jgi:thiol-disulfide isomerase/thioredoxin